MIALTPFESAPYLSITPITGMRVTGTEQQNSTNRGALLRPGLDPRPETRLPSE